VQHAKEIAPEISEYLNVHRTPFISASMPMHQARAKIAESSKNAEAFMQKYNNLKSKNNKDVDVFVFFLSELTDKPEVSLLNKFTLSFLVINDF
jgi:hypothetical protein